MAREVERRIKATLLKPDYRRVALETATGDSLGIFEIPTQKDGDVWLVHWGYSKVGHDESGEVWLKAVTLT